MLIQPSRPPIELRDYQARDLERIRAAFRRFRSVCYQAPTGSGKTAIFSRIAWGVASKSRSAWILLHREELVRQTSETLAAFGVPHDLVVPDEPGGDAPIQVCSVQTLVRRIERGRARPVDLIVVDEAHHAVAGSWRRILDSRPGARILGVTATPSRLDGQGLGVGAGGVFEELILGPSIRELTAAGWLSPTVVHAPPPVADLEGLRVRAGDFEREELAARLDKPTITGDAVAHYSRMSPGRPALAFCVSIAHAEHVAQQFRGAGFRAESVDGKLHEHLRRRRILDLAEGRLDVLTSCDLVSEGTDIPRVETMIGLRPTQSRVLYGQQVGRAMRPAPGKTRALILDHVGNVYRHGLPDADYPWTLAGRPRRQRGDVTPPAVQVRQCPRCFAAHVPAPTCPECGHVYAPTIEPPRQVAGELVEVSRAAVEAERLRLRREVGRARSLAELQAIAERRGYDPRWAHMIMRARGGRRA